MNKYDRIKNVRAYGLNTEDSVLIKTANELKRSRFVKARDWISLRTFYNSEKINLRAPAIPVMKKVDLLQIGPDLMAGGLSLIVGDLIDPKDCRLRGCIWINELRWATIEIATGPGTVRTVTNDGMIDAGWYNLKPWEITDSRVVDECLRTCRAARLTQVIFEFSYYNVPVGWKNTNFICWEVTPDGTLR